MLLCVSWNRGWSDSQEYAPTANGGVTGADLRLENRNSSFQGLVPLYHTLHKDARGRREPIKGEMQRSLEVCHAFPVAWLQDVRKGEEKGWGTVCSDLSWSLT